MVVVFSRKGLFRPFSSTDIKLLRREQLSPLFVVFLNFLCHFLIQEKRHIDLIRSSGTATSLIPLKENNKCTRYEGGSIEVCLTIVPIASVTAPEKPTSPTIIPAKLQRTCCPGCRPISPLYKDSCPSHITGVTNLQEIHLTSTRFKNTSISLMV